MGTVGSLDDSRQKDILDLIRRLAAALPAPGGRSEWKWAWEVLSDDTREDLRQLKQEADEYLKGRRG
jgi:hypothetical protein